MGVIQVSGTACGRSDAVSECSLYLDAAMRARLLAEHAVQCCTIVQRLGDIVLVPAMSHYQVSMAARRPAAALHFFISGLGLVTLGAFHCA